MDCVLSHVILTYSVYIIDKDGAKRALKLSPKSRNEEFPSTASLPNLCFFPSI